MNKTVSIVIPTHNRKHTLSKVLDTYLHQESLKELIFVDDGSTDGTFEYLMEKSSSHPCVKVIRNQVNRGVSASRNQGIDVARGEYILFGEDDLFLADDYVSKLLECMDKTNADIIAGRIVYRRVGEEVEETIRRCDAYKGPLINYWLMSAAYSKRISVDQKVPFLHAISLAKTDVCRQIRFDEDFFAREETDYCLRAVTRGLNIVLCPHTLCVHLPRDKDRGGGWRVGLLRYQYLATSNNNMLVDRHYKILKEWGMKGNKLTFKILHLINRLRIMYLYFRYSTRHNQNVFNSSRDKSLS